MLETLAKGFRSARQRLTGVEVMSLEELGRPRVDVVCRISGFFRDAFPHILGVLDDATGNPFAEA